MCFGLGWTFCQVGNFFGLGWDGIGWFGNLSRIGLDGDLIWFLIWLGGTELEIWLVFRVSRSGLGLAGLC